MQNSDIKIINLPVSRWEEYKNLRLESLQNDPQAFGTPVTKALKDPDEWWKTILHKNDKDLIG